MKNNIVKFHKNIKEISAEELKEKLDDLKDSEIMRSIILNEKEFCTYEYERSLRSFWYSDVQPTLYKLGKLSPEELTEKNLKDWDKKLSKYLAELVKDGLQAMQI